MPDATLTTGDGRPVIRLERPLRHPAAEVWRALTDPEALTGWFPGTIITDVWEVGAPLTFREEGHPDSSGMVLELEEARLLSFTWWGDVLRFGLTPQPDGGTLLVLTDELDADTAARNAAGWEVCLGRLLDGDGADIEWGPRFDHYADLFEPALGAQAGPPPGYGDAD
ncbi:MAG: SRPBCC domain-containing protein [Acidimicrobiales bacterium]|jgi:uncharacterized protein YndB with AHSA1/START domain